MAYNRDSGEQDKGGGGRPFDMGEDFQNFLQTQPKVDPNNPEGSGAQQPSGPVDPGGNSENPRERGGGGLTQVPGNPDMPRPGSPAGQPSTMTPPSPEASLAGHQTPPQSMAPNPISAGPGAPVTPLKGPSPAELVGGGQLGQGMLGSAGGLLGGGLGVPGKVGSDDENSQLLPLLMQLLGQ